MSPTKILNERGINALRLELSVQRSLKKLTYDGLSALSGVSRRTLISIETGQSRGSLETWLKICRALEYDFSKFVEMSEDVRDLTIPNFGPDAILER
jgi:DNA-binding XRE family transcriptional regulator